MSKLKIFLKNNYPNIIKKASTLKYGDYLKGLSKKILKESDSNFKNTTRLELENNIAKFSKSNKKDHIIYNSDNNNYVYHIADEYNGTLTDIVDAHNIHYSESLDVNDLQLNSQFREFFEFKDHSTQFSVFTLYSNTEQTSKSYVILLDNFLLEEEFNKRYNPAKTTSSYALTDTYYCGDSEDVDGVEYYNVYNSKDSTFEYKSANQLLKDRKKPKQINCGFNETQLEILEKNNKEYYNAFKACCEKETKKTTPTKTKKSTTPTLEIEPETKTEIPEDYIFPDFANDPEEESGIGRRKKPQVQPELDTDIDNMIEDVERKRGFFPTNADVKGIMRGESFINFREQDTRGKEVISEMQKLMRDAGANIQPDGSFGKEMKEKLSNLLSKPISYLGKEQYLKLAEMANEKGKTNWLIGYVAANEGVSPEEYYELMNNKETRKQMVSTLKEEGLGRLRTFIKNRRSARAKGIPRSKRRRFFRR